MSLRTPSEHAAMDAYRASRDSERSSSCKHGRMIAITDVLLLLVGLALLGAAAISHWRG